MPHTINLVSQFEDINFEVIACLIVLANDGYQFILRTTSTFDVIALLLMYRRILTHKNVTLAYFIYLFCVIKCISIYISSSKTHLNLKMVL